MAASASSAETEVGPLGLAPGLFFRSHASLLGRLFRGQDPRGLVLRDGGGLASSAAARRSCSFRGILERRSGCCRWRSVTGVGTGHVRAC